MTKRIQMLALCDQSMGRLAVPFPVEWRGRTWDCATNGSALLLLPDDTWQRTSHKPQNVVPVLDKVDAMGSTMLIDGTRLQEWAFGDGLVCPECHGSSYIADDGGLDVLCGCDDGLRSSSEASVGEVPFNRRLLHRFLSVYSAYSSDKIECVRWSTPTDPIFFCAHDQDPRIVVMPWRSSEIGAKLEELRVDP